MRIVLFGPPGSGKGTQASILEAEYGAVHISTGDILREAVAKGSEMGLRAKSYMDRGELVPDEVVIAIARERLSSVGNDGFVLDGFPRTIPQAEALDTVLGDLGKPLEAVVNLDVDQEELIRRLSGRRVCSRCGEVYHLESNPPREAGRCDKCGGDLVQREDDKPEAIKNRLEVYREQTAPVLDYYRSKGLLRDVVAEGEIYDIAQRIVASLGVR
ncbi:MAG: adenylate kinase [Armatimonadota bacterium]